MQTYLITTDEVSKLTRGMSVYISGDKIEAYIREAENMDVRPALGDALFLDIKAEPEKYQLLLSGGEYETKCGDKRILVGLKSALAYYSYARLVKNIDGNVTRFGYVNKDDEYSSRPEFREKLQAYNDAFDVASRYMKECVDYLRENRDTYPLCRMGMGKIKTNGATYKIIGE